MFAGVPRHAPLLAAITFQFMSSEEGGEEAGTCWQLPQQQHPAGAVFLPGDAGAEEGSGRRLSCESGASGGVAVARHGDVPACPEMDRLLGVFLEWQQHVRDYLVHR